MAYVRYGRNSKYYVFWHESKEQAALSENTRSEQSLAIWHEDHRSETDGTLFTYDQVTKMLEDNDFRVIAGFQSNDRDFLRPLLLEFVADVEAECQTQS